MTDTIELTDLFIILEINYEDVPQCEVQHREVPSMCTEEATHIVAWCQGTTLACSWAADNIQKRRLNPHLYCSKCKRPAAVCWNVRPL